MRALLVTDSPEPSGVGEHMLTLAAALAAEGIQAALAFPDHDAGRRLVERAWARGLTARIVAGDWQRALAHARADLVHVHAGIGWEGHRLTDAARSAGAAVIRTEHLPWLLTEPWQIAENAAATAQVDAVIAV